MKLYMNYKEFELVCWDTEKTRNKPGLFLSLHIEASYTISAKW